MNAKNSASSLNQRLFAVLASGWQYITERSLFWPFVAFFLFTNLLVIPVGEFPLGDDWIHARAVERLLAEGYYRGHSYVAANLVAQVYWGALFVKLFGFSFTVLRISTLILSIIGAWAMARCAIALGLSRNQSLLCGVLVAINPIALNLSYSFMTDAPFLAMSILSGMFFVRAFQTPHAKLIFWGSFFSVVAFFIRQFGVMLPIAFAATVLLLWLRKWYGVSWRMVFAFISPWIAGVAIYFYLATIKETGTPIFDSVRGRELFAAIIGIRHIPVSFCYLGLFTLPLGAGRFWQIFRKYDIWTRKRFVAFAAFCCVSLAVFFLPKLLFVVNSVFFHKESAWLNRFPYRMPLLIGDSLLDLAVGHIQLPDLAAKPPVQIGEWWWFATVPALAVGGLLFLNCLDRLRDVWMQEKENPMVQRRIGQGLFLVVWGGLLLAIAYNPGRVFVFDRYLLPALPPFILLLVREMSQFKHKGAMRLASFSCVLVYAFSVMCLQDYMAWNRTAWIAQDKLMTVYRVSPESIRGVDTFNGWYNSEKFMQIYQTKNWRDANLTGLGPWTFDNQYIVTGEEARPGYEMIERIPYFSWLGMKERGIVIYRRK